MVVAVKDGVKTAFKAVVKPGIKRKVLAFACVFFVCQGVFARGGCMSGTKGALNEIHTRYFDLIFPDSCLETARKIAGVCDSYYEEIAAGFGYEPYQRFPVSITDQVESANAYFSMAPYNLIVFYDADPGYSLDMNEKTVEAMFYHELVHAVSLNAKSPFWRGMAFFGDFFTPAGISLTSFWFEGAAVAFESLGAGGRLNDPFFTQKITAAKMKSLAGGKNFPSWRDVSGARDVFPYGNDAYIFGSCFARYLIQKYGKEKYAEFWKNAGTSTTLSFCAGIFKKTYGIKLDDVWNDFSESLWVPRIEPEDYSNFVSDGNLPFSVKKDRKSLVVTADSFFDEACGFWKTVWYDQLSCSVYMDSKKLFTAKNVQRLRFSEDGEKILVSTLASRSNIKTEDFEYDLRRGKKKRIEHSLENFEKVQGLRPEKNGLEWSLVYESKDGRRAEWNLGNRIIHNVHFEEEKDGILKFVFVWAKMNCESLGRIGRIFIDKETLNIKIQLLAEDCPAFFIEAVPCKDGYLVINEEYDANPLRFIKIEESQWENFSPVSPAKKKNDEKKLAGEEGGMNVENTAAGETADKLAVEDFKKSLAGKTPADSSAEGSESSAESSESPVDSPAEKKTEGISKYNPFRYFFKGAVLPVGVVKSFNHDFETEELLFLGASFVTSNPWTDRLTLFSAGYSPLSGNGGFECALSGGDGRLAYSFSGDFVFDSEGVKNTCVNSALSASLWKGLFAGFSLGAEALWLYGSEENAVKTEVLAEGKVLTAEYRRDGNSADAKAYLKFSTVHSAGARHSQKSGFYLKPFVDFQKSSLTCSFDLMGKKYETSEKYVNCGAEAGLYLPFFLPVSAGAALFPAKDCFASGTAAVELFSGEIHRGIPAFSLYAQRIVLRLAWLAKAEYDSGENFDIKKAVSLAQNLEYEDFSDSLRLSLEFTLAPNTSYFASSSGNFSLGGYLEHLLRTDKNSKWKAGLYASLSG